MVVRVSELMEQSGVKFGTSGARGLADNITDRIAYAYTIGFLKHLAQRFGEPAVKAVALAGDLRPSTPRIVRACAAACTALGYQVHYGGEVPSPAIALYGIRHGMPSIMVTGSHIPDDRNGIKFNRADGEIDKEDEQGMRAVGFELDEALFTDSGALIQPPTRLPVEGRVEAQYAERFGTFFGQGALSGARIGVYQHSTVGRDLLVAVLQGLGARVTPLGRSSVFIPVDTEAVRPEDVALAHDWTARGDFDAIVSADGDCDRPLLSNETGEWLRGDVLGVLCAQFLGATAIATPVSCNTVVELCGAFSTVVRTQIGSPYVIAQMQALSAAGAGRVVGYEANGGFLQQDPLLYQGRVLSPLPTRDALLPIIALLLAARAKHQPLSALVASLPARFTASDRIKGLPTEQSQALIQRLATADNGRYCELEAWFGDLSGSVTAVDETDGLRVTFSRHEIIHLRPSGNAPELRCYTEADTSARARLLTEEVLRRIARGGNA